MAVQVQVACAKELYELSKGLADFVLDVRKAVADGWQPGADLPALLTSAVGRLVPAMQGVEKLKDEYAGSKKEFLLGALVPLADVLGTLVDGK